MRWTIFAFFAYVFLALDMGLTPMLEIGSGERGVAPCFLLILMVYIASMGPSHAVRWAALILGLILDLSASHATSDGRAATVVGPYALGFVLGAALTVQLRGLVYRRHPFTTGFLTLVSGACAFVPAVFLLTMRRIVFTGLGSESVIVWVASDALVHAFLTVLYSALVAVPTGWVLNRLVGLFGFQVHPRLGHPR